MQKGGQDLNLGWQRKELHQLLSQYPQLMQSLPGPSFPLSAEYVFLSETVSYDCRIEKQTTPPPAKEKPKPKSFIKVIRIHPYHFTSLIERPPATSLQRT